MLYVNYITILKSNHFDQTFVGGGDNSPKGHEGNNGNIILARVKGSALKIF